MPADDTVPSHPKGWAVIARVRPLDSVPELAELEQFEAQRFDVPDHAEHGRAVLEQAGEDGVAAVEPRHHRRKGRQSGGAQPTLYADRVQARLCGHEIMLSPDLVSRRRRNLVIAWATGGRAAAPG